MVQDSLLSVTLNRRARGAGAAEQFLTEFRAEVAAALGREAEGVRLLTRNTFYLVMKRKPRN